jgi:acyl-CoA reductase-like NAD-dependent aldehyde dehydrogenase
MSATMTPTAALAPAAVRKAESRDPATGVVWRSYPTADAAAVRAAMDAARAAQVVWGAESLRHRAQAVERFRRRLFERRAEVADVVMRENGKPAVEALTTEIMVTLDLARFFARRAPHVLADRHFTPFNIAMWRKRVTVRHEPLGVVGVNAVARGGGGQRRALQAVGILADDGGAARRDPECVGDPARARPGAHG